MFQCVHNICDKGMLILILIGFSDSSRESISYPEEDADGSEKQDGKSVETNDDLSEGEIDDNAEVSNQHWYSCFVHLLESSINLQLHCPGISPFSKHID